MLAGWVPDVACREGLGPGWTAADPKNTTETERDAGGGGCFSFCGSEFEEVPQIVLGVQNISRPA